MTKHPTIYRAAELIVRDGGGINRSNTLLQHQSAVSVVLEKEWTAEELDRVEAFLLTLTPAQLDLLCTGDEDEVHQMLMDHTTNAPDYLDDLLEELSQC